MKTILAALVLDIILVPAILTFTVIGNLFWIVTIASKLGKLGFPFILVSVFLIATSLGYWFISEDQSTPKTKQKSYQVEQPPEKNDCERLPSIYGC